MRTSRPLFLLQYARHILSLQLFYAFYASITDDSKGSTQLFSLAAISRQYIIHVFNSELCNGNALRMPQVCKMCADNAYVNFRSRPTEIIDYSRM